MKVEHTMQYKILHAICGKAEEGIINLEDGDRESLAEVIGDLGELVIDLRAAFFWAS